MAGVNESERRHEDKSGSCVKNTTALACEEGARRHPKADDKEKRRIAKNKGAAHLPTFDTLWGEKWKETSKSGLLLSVIVSALSLEPSRQYPCTASSRRCPRYFRLLFSSAPLLQETTLHFCASRPTRLSPVTSRIRFSTVTARATRFCLSCFRACGFTHPSCSVLRISSRDIPHSALSLFLRQILHARRPAR